METRSLKALLAAGVRARREELGLSQFELADSIGSDQTSISKMEVSGERLASMSIHRFVFLMGALKIKPSTFFKKIGL